MRTALARLIKDHSVNSLVFVGQALLEAKREVQPSWFDSCLDWKWIETWLVNAEWYEVFDFIEIRCRQLHDNALEVKINDLLAEFGIGWKVLNGQIEVRGDEPFEQSIRTAREALEHAGRWTAQSELEEAIADLSRRPRPDARGAIIRSVGALEALARDLANDSNATLGQTVKRLALPQPLDQAAEKLWGYASDSARHVTEGHSPSGSEALFVVQVCAAFISYLSEQAPTRSAVASLSATSIVALRLPRSSRPTYVR
jgi:hypothetical protein